MQHSAPAVAKKENRIGHDYDPGKLKHIYLRRSTPREPPELCVGEEGELRIYKLTNRQLFNLARDVSGLLFSYLAVSIDGKFWEDS